MAQYTMEIPLFDHFNAFVILFSYCLVKYEVKYLSLIAVYPKPPLKPLQPKEGLSITYVWEKRHQSGL